MRISDWSSDVCSSDLRQDRSPLRQKENQPCPARGGSCFNPQAFGAINPGMNEFAAIVLAAGKGTRMKSDLHKVLHPIAGRPMLDHLLASVEQLGPHRTVVVAGHGREQIEAALGTRATVAVQEPQLGTGHAVQQAEAALAGFSGDVLVLYGDVPFVRPATMRQMLDRLHEGDARSEEHTSELQSLMRISYA